MNFLKFQFFERGKCKGLSNHTQAGTGSQKSVGCGGEGLQVGPQVGHSQARWTSENRFVS